MSNFIAKAINPSNGEIQRAEYLDNYFGQHNYGVRFPDGDIWPEHKITRVVDEYPPVNPLQSCCWLHEGPACSCHIGNAVFCTECGHAAECHETVRVSL